jgi:hypothetical protein
LVKGVNVFPFSQPSFSARCRVGLHVSASASTKAQLPKSTRLNFNPYKSLESIDNQQVIVIPYLNEA